MDKKIVGYIILGLLLAGVVILTFFPGIIHAWKDSGSSSEDKCSTPPGYTEESWREHMSHHPNIYRECLV